MDVSFPQESISFALTAPCQRRHRTTCPNRSHEGMSQCLWTSWIFTLEFQTEPAHRIIDTGDCVRALASEHLVKSTRSANCVRAERRRVEALDRSYFDLDVGASFRKGKCVARSDFPGYISRRGTAAPSSSKTRRWVGVAVESSSNELPVSVVTAMVLRVSVAR